MLYDDDQPKGILTFDSFRRLIEGISPGLLKRTSETVAREMRSQRGWSFSKLRGLSCSVSHNGAKTCPLQS